MSQANASLVRLSALAVFAGLLCAQGACSLRSLDQLKNGQRPDAAMVDSRGADIKSHPSLDATGFDADDRDNRAQDGAGEIDGTGGSDGMTGDNKDSGELDIVSTPEVEADLRAADDTTDDVPVTGAGDLGTDEAPDAIASGDDGDSVEGGGGTIDILPGFDSDVGTGGMTGTGGNGGAGGSSGDGGSGGNGGSAGNGDARGGTGGSTRVDAGPADTSSTCAGLANGGICWYLGSQGLSCQQFCASHGQPEATAATYVGSTRQGGSVQKCALLLDLLGVSDTPQTATRKDSLGLGCHLLVQDGSTYWLSSPDFSVTASGATTRLVCGCSQ